MRRAWSIAVLLLCGAVLAGAADGRQIIPYGYDLHGMPIAQLASPGVRAIVLFFVATDCPISNRYVPEIQRLEKEFSRRDVVFWLVYPNATETADGVVGHQANFGLTGASLARPTDRLMALAAATVTPEAVVLAPSPGQGTEPLKAVYTGRIDDRYLEIGRERPQAAQHDLEEAIKAVLGGRPALAPGGPPVGCGIVSEAALQIGAGER